MIGKTYKTMGIDELGQVYGLELEADGKWRKNPIGASTSCVVIRPVSKQYMEEMREDEETVKDLWKEGVRLDETELGLREWFEQLLETDSDSIWYYEGWPTKDESWCWELLEDPDNPTLETGGFKGCDSGDDDFRKFVEKKILECPEIKSDAYPVGTWESAGWWSPEKPFVVELADNETLEEYYKHLEEVCKDFHREPMKED